MNFAFLNDTGTAPAVTKKIFTSFSYASSGGSWYNTVMASTTGTTYTATYDTYPTAVSFPTEWGYNGICGVPGTNILISYASQTKDVVFRSTDGGVTWGTATIPTGTSIVKIVYGNGRLVAICANQGAIYSTDDGVTWSSLVTITSNTNFRDICYSTSDTFVAVGQPTSGTVRRAISTDGGVTWSTGTIATVAFTSICYDPINALYLACGSSGTSRIYSSTNGTSWTARSTSAKKWQSISTDGAGNTLVFSPLDNNGECFYSTNGTTWNGGANNICTGGTVVSTTNFIWDGTRFCLVYAISSGPTVYALTSATGATVSSSTMIFSSLSSGSITYPTNLGTN